MFSECQLYYLHQKSATKSFTYSLNKHLALFCAWVIVLETSDTAVDKASSFCRHMDSKQRYSVSGVDGGREGQGIREGAAISYRMVREGLIRSQSTRVVKTTQ